MSLSSVPSAYEGSTCPSFCRNPYPVEFRSKFSVLLVHDDFNDYVDFQEFIGRTLRLSYLPYFPSARFTSRQLSADEGVADGITVELGLQKEACVSIPYLWPNELMPFPDVYIYYAVLYNNG